MIDSGVINNGGNNSPGGLVSVNQTGIGTLMVLGDVVSQDASNYIKANATDETKPALGVVVQIIDNDNIVFQTQGLATYTKANLTKGDFYYLDTTDGNVTSTEPTNYVQPVFEAVDTNTIIINIDSLLIFEAGGVSSNRLELNKVDLGNLSGDVNIDLSIANIDMTLNGNIDSITFLNPPDANKVVEFYLNVYQDVVGGRTIDWNDIGIIAEDTLTNLEYQPKTAANSLTQYRLYWNGVNYLINKTEYGNPLLTAFSYLFDVEGQGEIGFSTQKLSSATSQFGLVRRSSDGTTDILNFDGDEISLDSTLVTAGTDLATWAQGGNVTIQEWYNQGTGPNVTQATTTLQPFIVQSGVLVTSDGHPAVFFNDNEYMQDNDTMSLTQPCSWSIKVDLDDKGTNANQIPIDGGPAGTLRQIPFWLDDNAGVFVWFAGTNQNLNSLDFNSNIWFTVFDNPNSLAYQNNTDVTTTQPGGNGLTGLTIGARFSGSSLTFGHISEIVAWDTDKGANRNAIYTTIQNKFS